MTRITARNRYLQQLIVTIVVASAPTGAFAKGSQANKKVSTKGTTITKETDLKTDVNFADGSSVFGNYGNMSEGDASVESEKRRIDLIEPRKKWNLKMTTSKEWHK